MFVCVICPSYGLSFLTDFCLQGKRDKETMSIRLSFLAVGMHPLLKQKGNRNFSVAGLSDPLVSFTVLSENH